MPILRKVGIFFAYIGITLTNVEMRKILYLSLAVSLSSCAVMTQTVDVEILKSGNESLPISPDDRIVVLANYKPNAKFVRKKITAFVDDSVQVAATANLFSDYYRSVGTFTSAFVPIKYKLRPNTDSNDPVSLSKKEIDQLTLLDRSRYVIDISLLRTLIEKTDALSYKTSYASLWRVYDAKDGKMVREIVYKDSLYYDQYERVSRSELDSIIASDVSYRVADRLGSVLFPYWDRESRFYMVVQDPVFMKVKDLIRDFKWKEVISLMTPFLETGDKNDAYAASFNIALACEMVGNYDLALKWLEKCERIKSNYTTNLYKAILINRQSESSRILE